MEVINRSLKGYLGVLARGMAMGAADIVPGVSGGTVALITGIYQELLDSLKNLTPAKLLILFKEGPAAFWGAINGNFLLALFGGILLSIKTLASVVGYCLDNYPLLVWGFFSGLIVGAIVIMVRSQPHWKFPQWAGLAVGAVFVLAVGVLKPMQLPDAQWLLFFGGFIAICAMILPGISGSFLLLMMGLYPRMLSAVESLDVTALLIFLAGCVSGLMVFSRFLSWLLHKFYATTLATMIGFLVGSLYTTWPWKEVVETTVDRHGEIVPLLQRSVLPGAFEALGGVPQTLLVLSAALSGVVLVLLVEFVGSQQSKGASKV